MHLIAWPWSETLPWCGRKGPVRTTAKHAEVTCRVCVKAAVAAGYMASA